MDTYYCIQSSENSYWSGWDYFFANFPDEFTGLPYHEYMKFIYHDGGRTKAGFKDEVRDCVTRSIAIATGIPYIEVYRVLNELARHERTGKSKKSTSSARDGVFRITYQKFLEEIGWQWTPTMHIGQGCKVHLRAEELPDGALVVKVTKHLTAVIDGVVYDTHDPSRNGTRCVYGYFKKSPSPRI